MAVNSQRAKLACKWNITHRIVWDVKFGTDVFIHILGLSLGWWGFPWLLNNGASSQQEHTQLITVGEHFFDICYALHSQTTMKLYCTHTPFSCHDKALGILQLFHIQFPLSKDLWSVFSISPTVFYIIFSSPTKKCMKILWISDGGLASCGLGPANDQHSRRAKIRPITGLHHDGHHQAASLQ